MHAHPSDTLPHLATAALRCLCAAPAMTFGSLLLARAHGNTVTFPAFVQAARDMVAAMPEEAATWLAALVALDMTAADTALPTPRPPSDN